jgi:hypothetical protein
MDTLFEVLSGLASVERRRREWVAQELLIFALGSQKPVLARLMKCLGFSSVDAFQGVDSERPQIDWRTDLLIRTKTGSRCVELKLNSSLTPQQRKAVASDKIHLIVAPQNWQDVDARGIPRISWSELAEVSKQDVVLSGLFAQAESASGSLVALGKSEATGDFGNTMTGAPIQRRSFALLNFLTTLHGMLEQRYPRWYRAAGGWSSSRAKRYVGYLFTWRSSAYWWIGFWASPKASTPELWLEQPKSSRNERFTVTGNVPGKGPCWDAGDVAIKVGAYLNAQ